MDRLRSVVMAVLGTSVACSGGGGGGRVPVVVTQTVGAEGAAIEITGSSDPAIAGTTLLIPAGALSAPTQISVSSGTAIAGTGEVAIGPSVRFLPDGLVFAKPASLTLPFTPSKQPAGSAVAIDYRSGGARGQYGGDFVTVDREVGAARVDISHFTDYQVVAVTGTTGSCRTNSDCVDGQVCVSGVCTGGKLDGGTDGGKLDGGTDGGNPDGSKYDGGNPDGSKYDGGVDGGSDGP